MKANKVSLLLIVVIILGMLGVVYMSFFNNQLDIQAHSQKIMGTLIDEGKESIVIITPGSGPTDRDGNSQLMPGKNDSLRMLAKGISESGISIYRYDKQSSKDLLFSDFIEDLVEVIKYFRDDGYENIYLAGHSQGALVAFAAANLQAVEGVISLNGAGRSIDLTIADQIGVESIGPYLEMVRKGEEFTGELEALKQIFRKETIDFLSSWIEYNPCEELKEISVPVLLVRGRSDLQVSDIELKLLHQAKPEAKVVLVDKMNHVLKIVENQEENVASYNSPDFQISDILIEEVVAFIS